VIHQIENGILWESILIDSLARVTGKIPTQTLRNRIMVPQIATFVEKALKLPQQVHAHESANHVIFV
jgi:hypothetical protein